MVPFAMRRVLVTRLWLRGNTDRRVVLRVMADPRIPLRMCSCRRQKMTNEQRASDRERRRAGARVIERTLERERERERK